MRIRLYLQINLQYESEYHAKASEENSTRSGIVDIVKVFQVGRKTQRWAELQNIYVHFGVLIDDFILECQSSAFLYSPRNRPTGTAKFQ